MTIATFDLNQMAFIIITFNIRTKYIGNDIQALQIADSLVFHLFVNLFIVKEQGHEKELSCDKYKNLLLFISAEAMAGRISLFQCVSGPQQAGL